ncbi:MAG: aminotransferase class I/II-fold pyridoxal phosphate-dependent enzyme [Candidatus Hodarchaeales archaeon]|jgi:O-acetylhomoserine/O-acetylserine sulfhydrylase-like pyridoxal-dependent enzyme
MPESKYLNKRIAELEEELAKLRSTSSEEEYFLKRSKKQVEKLNKKMLESKDRNFHTVEAHGLYCNEERNRLKSQILPIFSTPTGGGYDSLVDGSLLLSYQTINDPNKIYSRIDNTTVDHLAMKLAALEGMGIPEITQGLVTSSGMSAIFTATMPFLNTGDNFVSSCKVYGGSNQLFDVTYKKSDWQVRWVEEPDMIEKWQEKIDYRTKFLFVESPSNPTLYVANIPELAKLAHDNNIPLIVDSTIASPALMRPFEFGADIVVHSLSKIIGSSGRNIAGAIIGKERIVTKDKEYEFNFVNKLKGGHFRNLGPCLSPQAAGIIWDNLNTLSLRVKAVSENAMKIANFLEGHEMIESVNYPGLSSHPQHDIANELFSLHDGAKGYFGFLMSFYIRGGLEVTKKFAEDFKFGLQVTDLGRDYTIWVHNASTTHGQVSDEMKRKSGVLDNMIRYSVGLEGSSDAIKALNETLSNLSSTIPTSSNIPTTTQNIQL